MPKKPVSRETAKKLQDLLGELSQDQKQGLGRVLAETGIRSYWMAQAMAPSQEDKKGPSEFTGTEEKILVIGAIIAAEMLGGIAGHLWGGGSIEDIPWGEIFKESIPTFD